MIANEFTEAVSDMHLQRLDRDRPGAVYRHHHRQRLGPPAGLGGHARRAGADALETAGCSWWNEAAQLD